VPQTVTPEKVHTGQAPAHWRTDALVVALGLLALLAWDASGLDLALIHAVGRPSGFA
jgi:hypothetical protein